MKSHKLNVFPLLLLMPSTSLLAANNGISVDLGASARYSDNARKQEVDEISEQQNEFNLGVNANFNNDWMYLTSNYDATRQTYEKDTQPDYDMLEGRTELNFGGVADPASLLLSHSRRSLLNSPDALNLSSNRDERNIATAAPKFVWRANGADSLMLSGSISDISYRVNEEKDSTQSGGQLAWMRNISKVDQFQLTASASKTKFDNVPAADYEYQSAGIQYSTQLNHLTYSINLGANRAIRDDEEEAYSHPSYTFQSTYTSGLNSFELFASQMITDSSRGNGNRQSFVDRDDESNNVGVDLINMRSVELSWSTSALCDRCLVNVNATNLSNDYQTLPEDNSDTSAGVGVSYKVTRAASLHLNLGRHKINFSEESIRGDYTADRGSISFNYQMVNQLNVKVYVEAEKRESPGSSQNYDEHITGISLSYSF